jgi:hypothetical protein
MAQATLATTGGPLLSQGVDGQVADLETAQIISRVNSQATAIDFGVAVFRTVGDDPDTCRVQHASTDLYQGISVRLPTMTSSSDADTLSTVNYGQNKPVPILIDGLIFCVAAETVKADQQCYGLQSGGGGKSSAGSLGSIEGGATSSTRLALTSTKWIENTTSGSVGRVRVKYLGDYTTTT